MSWARNIFFLALILCVSPSWAQSCLPSHTALQSVLDLNPETFPGQILPLRVLSRQKMIESRVRLELGPAVQGRMESVIRFDPSFDGVSLPFQLYAVMVASDGQVLAWWDYTNACQGPGLSFFPGRTVTLPPLKLVGSARRKLQIMVWGKF